MTQALLLACLETTITPMPNSQPIMDTLYAPTAVSCYLKECHCILLGSEAMCLYCLAGPIVWPEWC